MTEPTPSLPQDETPKHGNTKAWVIGGVAALVVLVAAITIPLVSASQQRAAEEKAEAEAAKAEKVRLAQLSNAVLDCDVRLSSLDVAVIDGGEALELSGVSKTFASDVQTDDLYCILGELGAPSAIESKIGSTRALDGRQSDEWDGFTISWSYHPDDGANVLIEHDR